MKKKKYIKSLVTIANLRKKLKKKIVPKYLPKKEKWKEFQHFEILERRFFCKLSKSHIVIEYFFCKMTDGFTTTTGTSDIFFLKLDMKLVTVFWKCMKLVTVYWNCMQLVIVFWNHMKRVTVFWNFTWNWLKKNQKKSRCGKKSSKSPVSYAKWVHFFILLSHSFGWNCRIKMAFWWQVSFSKVEFWASYMKPWYWHKMLRLSDSAGKKSKLTAQGFTTAVSFNFSGQHLAKSRYHETAKKFNFWHWNCHEKCRFYWQFQMKLVTMKKEKFLYIKPFFY